MISGSDKMKIKYELLNKEVIFSHSTRGEELEEKIKDLETIIEKLNDLINELIISSKDSKKSDDEIQNLFKDMDDLIDSVKKYE